MSDAPKKDPHATNRADQIGYDRREAMRRDAEADSEAIRNAVSRREAPRPSVETLRRSALEQAVLFCARYPGQMDGSSVVGVAQTFEAYLSGQAAPASQRHGAQAGIIGDDGIYTPI